MRPESLTLGGTATKLVATNDMNNVVVPGRYHTNNAVNPANMPNASNVYNNIIWVIPHNESTRLIQLIWSFNAGSFFIRARDSAGMFGDWYKIQPSALT